MKKSIIICAVVALVSMTGIANANTIASSTMVFQGSLTNLGGIYTGIVAMVDEGTTGLGDGVSGFDVYAKNGATAMYDKAGAGQDYAHGIVTEHDAYTTGGGWGSFYNPDCADWYNYQLRLTSDHWYLEYNAGVGNDGILTGAIANPMSGTMNWGGLFASENDKGAYYPSEGPAESPGYATSNPWVTGYIGHWDMDWSWGSENIPLEYPGFRVGIDYNVGDDTYTVTLTPAPEPGTMLLLSSLFTGLFGAVGMRRKFKR